MTIHITGDEFIALLKAITEADEITLIKFANSEELWISIRQIEDGVYKTVITNQIVKFQD